jgi:spermidine synthase
MKINKLLLIAFMVSGMTALIYEVLWTRPLQLIFGSTIYAFSTILTTFFVGFSFGAFIIRNFADKTNNPLAVFGLLQLGIGLYGLIILWLFSILTPIYLSLDVAGFQFIQFFLLFLIIITPAILFGMTWPVANKSYVGKEMKGKDIGMLYFSNSFGSFVGPLVAGFLMIPLFGIKTSVILTASLNLAVAIIIFGYLIFSNKKGFNQEVKNES